MSAVIWGLSKLQLSLDSFQLILTAVSCDSQMLGISVCSSLPQACESKVRSGTISSTFHMAYTVLTTFQHTKVQGRASRGHLTQLCCWNFISCRMKEKESIFFHSTFSTHCWLGTSQHPEFGTPEYVQVWKKPQGASYTLSQSPLQQSCMISRYGVACLGLHVVSEVHSWNNILTGRSFVS